MQRHSFPSIVEILPYQTHFRPDIPTVYGNVDYNRFKQQLERIDEILDTSGAEKWFVVQSLNEFQKQAQEAGNVLKESALKHHQKHAFAALRSMVLMSLLGGSYREMSRRLAECPLYRWFCKMDEMSVVRVPGKSLLQEYAHWFSEEEIQKVVEMILKEGVDDGKEKWKLENEIELETVWLDSTCVKANIHFPVDWVLLRDAVRTLMKAVKLIRKHGLKHRMEDPSIFLKRINGLSIQMSMSKRKKDSKKERKRIFREMKKVVKVVGGHARRYRGLLDERWEETDWTRKQAEVVLKRMDGILEILPLAREQAHERIIGGRLVENGEKILSLYEREMEVIVRKKAGAEVEFGNRLLLAEQKNGLIVDWKLYEKGSPADGQLLKESLERVEGWSGKKITGAGMDRGFDSQENREHLEKKKVFNGICPRDPHQLGKRLLEPRFVYFQKRRAQTEGRIGIFKNAFLGRPMRSKGFIHRQVSVSWHVLAHNLWVLARLPMAGEKVLKKAA